MEPGEIAVDDNDCVECTAACRGLACASDDGTCCDKNEGDPPRDPDEQDELELALEQLLKPSGELGSVGSGLSKEAINRRLDVSKNGCVANGDDGCDPKEE